MFYRNTWNHPTVCKQISSNNSLKNEVFACKWNIYREIEGLALTHSHKRTSMGPSRSCWDGTTSALQPEEITLKGTRVSCVYYQQKCPYEKSLETYLMILVYDIYIYDKGSYVIKHQPTYRWK